MSVWCAFRHGVTGLWTCKDCVHVHECAFFYSWWCMGKYHGIVHVVMFWISIHYRYTENIYSYVSRFSETLASELIEHIEYMFSVALMYSVQLFILVRNMICCIKIVLNQQLLTLFERVIILITIVSSVQQRLWCYQQFFNKKTSVLPVNKRLIIYKWTHAVILYIRSWCGKETNLKDMFRRLFNVFFWNWSKSQDELIRDSVQ